MNVSTTLALQTGISDATNVSSDSLAGYSFFVSPNVVTFGFLEFLLVDKKKSDRFVAK
jgi:hypothetical protein